MNAENKTLKSQIEDSKNQLGELQGQLKDNADAQKQVEKLQEQLQNVKKKSQDELLTVKKNNAINNALRDARVRDNKAIMPFLNTEEIKYNDNGLTGLKDQLKELKENKSFLFEEEKPEQPSGIQATAGKINKSSDGVAPKIDMKKASYSDLLTLKEQDPEKFN